MESLTDLRCTRYEGMPLLDQKSDYSVCAEYLQRSHFPEGRTMDVGAHDAQKCVDRPASRVDAQPNMGKGVEIPRPECGATPSYSDVRDYAQPPAYEKYDLAAVQNYQQMVNGGEPLPMDSTCISHGYLSIRPFFGQRKWIAVSGVRRRETYQEVKERKLAKRLREKVEKELKKQERLRGAQIDAAQKRAAAAQRDVDEARRQVPIEKKSHLKEAGITETERHERATAVYMTAHTKVCPGPKCGRRIEKTGGCDEMTCE